MFRPNKKNTRHVTSRCKINNGVVIKYQHVNTFILIHKQYGYSYLLSKQVFSKVLFVVKIIKMLREGGKIAKI